MLVIHRSLLQFIAGFRDRELISGHRGLNQVHHRTPGECTLLHRHLLHSLVVYSSR
jgi:hypothetical protein